MESILILVFSCLDIIFFYVFFESVLIPMYLILGFFGSRERKIYASYMFFVYTFVGSVLMLLAILFIFYYTGTTNYLVLLTCNFDPFIQKILWIAFFLSFAVHSCLSYLLPCFSICACVILLIITHFNAFRIVLIYDKIYALSEVI